MAVLPRLHLVSDTTDDRQGLLKAKQPLVTQLSQLTYCTASLLVSFRMVGKPEVILPPAIPILFRSPAKRGYG